MTGQYWETRFFGRLKLPQNDAQNDAIAFAFPADNRVMSAFEFLARAPRGDPYPTAWFITIMYFVVAGLCFWAGKKEKERSIGRARKWMAPTFWYVMVGLMIALGFNKQLDLQSDLTEMGRQLAAEEGWYGSRRVVQAIFIFFFAAGAIAAVVGAAWFMRDLWKRYRMAFAGIIYLCTFVIIRAASFHHIDNFLYHLPIGQFWVNTFFELGGEVIIGWAAYKAATNEPAQPKYESFEKRVSIRR